MPSAMESVTKNTVDILTLVDVDFDEYRRKHEMRTVRKNVSIPSWLNEEAESANINLSALFSKSNEIRITFIIEYFLRHTV